MAPRKSGNDGASFVFQIVDLVEVRTLPATTDALTVRHEPVFLKFVECPRDGRFGEFCALGDRPVKREAITVVVSDARQVAVHTLGVRRKVGELLHTGICPSPFCGKVDRTGASVQLSGWRALSVHVLRAVGRTWPRREHAPDRIDDRQTDSCYKSAFVQPHLRCTLPDETAQTLAPRCTLPLMVIAFLGLSGLDVFFLILTIASIVLSAVAVYVTIKIGVIADRSLKNSTTTGLSGVSQILRYMERKEQGTPDQALDVGEDVWTCDAVPESIALGETVKLRLHVWYQDSSKHLLDEPSLVSCRVTMPSGLIAFANTRPAKDEDYDCSWDVTFPTDFRDYRRVHAGDTNAEGVYLAEWEGLAVPPRVQATAFRVAARVPSLRETLRDLWPW
jgi:hypothetical protein